MTMQTVIPAAGAAAPTAAAPADVYRNGRFETDDWRRADPDAPLPAEGRVLLPLARFLELAAADGLGNKPLGVVIAPADRVRDLAPHLDRLSVIAVEFPKFNDGRGFSHAAHLARAGFKGELRAIGHVLIDQITMMKRQGFTAFSVSHGVTRRYLTEGRDPAPRLYYQPAPLPEAPAGTRPWLRRG